MKAAGELMIQETTNELGGPMDVARLFVAGLKVTTSSVTAEDADVGELIAQKTRAPMVRKGSRIACWWNEKEVAPAPATTLVIGVAAPQAFHRFIGDTSPDSHRSISDALLTSFYSLTPWKHYPYPQLAFGGLT
jgi:hypothetical protein